jgi:hypothetical protein
MYDILTVRYDFEIIITYINSLKFSLLILHIVKVGFDECMFIFLFLLGYEINMRLHINQKLLLLFNGIFIE